MRRGFMDFSGWTGFGCPKCKNGAKQTCLSVEPQKINKTHIVISYRCEDCQMDYDLIYQLLQANILEEGTGRIMTLASIVTPE